MLRTLRLTNFKNFGDATLSLGPLTVLVGANAAGKSNLRDAFRFLHGIARGYTLAEIIGEKWIEGGVLQWKGIRGGIREVCFDAATSFRLEADFDGTLPRERPAPAAYSVEVLVDPATGQPRLRSERLRWGEGDAVFDSHPPGSDRVSRQGEPDHVVIRMAKGGFQKKWGQRISVSDLAPALTQLVESPKIEPQSNREKMRQTMKAFESMRFLDLSPEAMRAPSVPGQTILGDRGENLSSVLHAICADDSRRRLLVEWLRELTPMDAADFEFQADAAGRILVTLVERSGQRISAYSASDGTLRFLGVIAALLGPHPASFYFFEELDNGIHPTRLHLLLQLIESQVAKGDIQVVATTHSPSLLAMLSPESLRHASLLYRLAEAPDGHIRRLLDLPQAERLIQKDGAGRLHASGWFEDAVALSETAS